MFNWLKEKWTNLKNRVMSWCRDSVTILYARLQMAVGFALAVIAGLDFTSLATFDWSSGDWLKLSLVSLGIVINGILTEAARRRTLNS